jgi:uncharacterized protein (TIGR00369 family)
MPTAEHYGKLQRMYLAAPINAYYAPTISIAEGRAEVTIAVRPELFHAAGAVHGAVYFKLLDDAAFFAANSLVDDLFLVTVSFNLYFMRPVSAGLMRAVGRVLYHSQRVLIAEAELSDATGREIARGSGTFMRSTIALASVAGYNQAQEAALAPGL